jgi:hypothetical protein
MRVIAVEQTARSHALARGCSPRRSAALNVRLRSAMMRMRPLALAAMALALNVGCATPYQPTGFRGGYSETQLAPDVFRIYFRGNAFTSPERAQDLVLLRAAQLGRERGFPYFAVLDERSGSTVHAYTTPGQSYSSGSATISGNVATYSSQTTYYPGQTTLMYKPNTGLVVRYFTEKPRGIYTFDVGFLHDSLRQKYDLR